ncbi:MAG: fasciclin domain-containing protein [Prevotella sp.]
MNIIKRKWMAGLTYSVCTLSLSVALSSCQDDAWNDHYDIAGSTATQNVMQILESNSELSIFTDFVKRQHLDTLLTQDQTFTVWAPTNSAMEGYQANGNETDHLLKNHINRYVYTSSDLTDTALVRIKMLNGKFHNYERTHNDYTFAGVTLGTDFTAANGLVRTLNSIAPFYLNIFETINSEDNATDSLSKYIKQFDEYTFDQANSTVTGKNQFGQLTYDSVFIYKNMWMQRFGYLYKEDSVYTVIMPTNTGWNAATGVFRPYFRTFGQMESSSLSAINVPTRKYATDDVLADSLTTAYTKEAITSSLVFRNHVNPETADGDSLTATNGNVFHHPVTLFSGAVEETVSNGSVWRTDQWNYQPEDCFYKEIVVEAEDTYNRSNYYSSVFSRSVSNEYADSVSNMRYVEVNATTTSARQQPMIQFAIPNVLAAEYDVYVVFVPAEAVDGGVADSTRVQFFLNYVHEDGTMKEDAAITNTTGFVTNGKSMTKMHVGRFKFPFANFTDSRFKGSQSQDDDCVRLRVQTSVPANETTKLTRSMRIDCIIFSPVSDN